MAKNFFQRVQLDDGTEAVAHVNRRGCKGEWTQQDADAMTALITAAVKQMRKLPESCAIHGPAAQHTDGRCITCVQSAPAPIQESPR